MERTKHNGDGHVTETPDVSHIRNLDVTHEVSDVNVRAILQFVIALTVMTVTVFILMWGLFRFFSSNIAGQEAVQPPGPMAMTEEERRPPEPRLQAAPGFGVKLEDGNWVSLEKREPQAEFRVIREQWEYLLQHGATDGSGNQVALPIEQAIDQLVSSSTQKSRVRKISEEGPGWFAEDYAIQAPTAASSGRQSQKRVQ